MSHLIDLVNLSNYAVYRLATLSSLVIFVIMWKRTKDSLLLSKAGLLNTLVSEQELDLAYLVNGVLLEEQDLLLGKKFQHLFIVEKALKYKLHVILFTYFSAYFSEVYVLLFICFNSSSFMLVTWPELCESCPMLKEELHLLREYLTFFFAASSWSFWTSFISNVSRNK